MKPRKTRKYSKKSENTYVSEDRDEVRGGRESKEYSIESIVPMEHSYAAKVKASQAEEGGAAKGDEKSDLVAVSYMSGNPSVQTANGILHLYRTDYGFDVSETGPSPMLLMVHVPVDIGSHQLIHFIGNYETKLESIKIIRDQTKDQYMVLLKFIQQEIADKFYHSINGIQFNSLLEERCQLAYVAKVEQLHPAEGAGQALPRLTELPACAVCLERMDESVRTVLTVLCNHSFHTSCLKKWSELTCPVCRYTQVPSADEAHPNQCATCGSTEDLWICLICGNVGCGRYTSEHAQSHYLETQHNFAMALSDSRVWDYHGDYFVHRLIQNDSSRKIVETKGAGSSTSQLMGGSGDEKNKAELELNIQMECMALLTSQLEKQRQYWEEKLKETVDQMKADNEKALGKKKGIFKVVRKSVVRILWRFVFLSSCMYFYSGDCITRVELTKEKSQWERKLKGQVERGLKVQRDLEAEREMNANLMKSKVELTNIVERLIWRIYFKTLFDPIQPKKSNSRLKSDEQRSYAPFASRIPNQWSG